MAKILVISPTPSHPQDAGNRARIFSLLSGLKAHGHKVFFVFVKMEVDDDSAMADTWDRFFSIEYKRPKDRWLKQKYDKWAVRLGYKKVFPYRIDDWYPQEVSIRLKEIGKEVKPDVVLVVYAFFSKALDCFDSNVLKILDTQDVFGGREKLFFNSDMKPTWFYTTEEEEKKGVERADIIMAIQPQEAEYFKKLTPKKVLTVGHIIKVAEPDETKLASPPRLLFVGSSNPSNRNGMKWFLDNVFNMLQEKVPGIELDVVGKACQFIKQAPGLNLLGSVENLNQFYQNASVVINPLQFGTGLKIKSLEALAMKKPLVTTPNGATGIEEWAGRSFLCAETPEEFAEAVMQIINSRDLRDKLKKGAGEFISKYNQNVLDPLLKEINLHLNKP